MGEIAEVFFYGMIPVLLSGGWWLMRQSLKPIKDLAQGVERIQADNLRKALPRSHSGDEVDRLTESFNAMTVRLDNSFQQVRQRGCAQARVRKRARDGNGKVRAGHHRWGSPSPATAPSKPLRQRGEIQPARRGRLS